MRSEKSKQKAGFPNDSDYSERNFRNMKRFAEAYATFPIWQVPLAKLKELPIGQVALDQFNEKDFVQVPTAKTSWYHHKSLKQNPGGNL